MVSVPLTPADLALIGDRMSESTRQGLKAAATEGEPGGYAIEMTEAAARDLAAKTANLGLTAIAAKVREELNGLTSQRRQRKGVSVLDSLGAAPLLD